MSVVVGVFGPHGAGKTTLIESLLERPIAQTILNSQCVYHSWESSAGKVSLVDTPGYERYIHHAYSTSLLTDVVVLCIGPNDANHPTWRDFLDAAIASPASALIVVIRGRQAPEELIKVVEKSRFSESKILENTQIEEIRTEIQKCIVEVPPKPGHFRWYMAIDSVDTLAKQGYSVTGVVAEGLPQAGHRASVYPGGHSANIRAVSKVDDSFTIMDAGSRVSMTLQGIDQYPLKVGMIVGSNEEIGTTDFFEVEIDWLSPPLYASEIRVSIGTEDVAARLFPSDLNPNVAQIKLIDRIAAVLGQRVLLRQLHPPLILGGGTVSTLRATLQRRLETEFEWDAEAPDVAILQILNERSSGVMTHEICRLMGVTQQDLGEVFAQLKLDRKVLGFGGTWFTPDVFLREAQRFLGCLSELHRAEPSVPYQSADRVMANMNRDWDPKCLDLICAQLATLKKIELEGSSRVKITGFKIALTGKQDGFLSRVEVELDNHGINTPYISEVAKALVTPTHAVEEIMKIGAHAGRLIEVSEGTYYTVAQLDKIKRKVELWAGEREFYATELRDFLDTSRRFVMPLLEYFDKSGFTIRDEDTRTIAK